MMDVSRLEAFVFDKRFLLLSAIAIVYIVVRRYQEYARHQDDIKFGEVHGCQAPQKFMRYKKPFALDRIRQAMVASDNKRILSHFNNVFAEDGNTFVQFALGERGVSTTDPEIVETILSTSFKDYGFGKRTDSFAPLLGDGIFTQDGLKWKHSRELLRPQFLRSQYQNFSVFSDNFDRMLKNIPTDEKFDIQPLFFRLTLHITCAFLFGKSMNTSPERMTEDDEFSQNFNLAQDYLALRGRFGPLYWLVSTRKFFRACRKTHEYVDRLVKQELADTEKKKSGAESYVFLDALISETRDPKVLRDQMINIMLAGRDTTACLLTWTFRLLAQNPEKLQRLRDEISSVLGPNGAEPTRNDLKRMTYLSLVLKEVLRLYPSVPVNSRTAIRPTVLPIGGGPDGTAPLLVHKGESIAYSVYTMHRRKDLYGEDAESFRPERWEDDQLANIGWGYLPFNGGPRDEERLTTPFDVNGQLIEEFALNEASYVVVRLLQKFSKIEAAAEHPMAPPGEERQEVTLVLFPSDGCWLKVSE